MHWKGGFSWGSVALGGENTTCTVVKQIRGFWAPPQKALFGGGKRGPDSGNKFVTLGEVKNRSNC